MIKLFEKLKDKLIEKRWIRKTIRINGTKVIISDRVKRGLCRLNRHDYYRRIDGFAYAMITHCYYECHYCGDSFSCSEILGRRFNIRRLSDCFVKKGRIK